MHVGGIILKNDLIYPFICSYYRSQICEHLQNENEYFRTSNFSHENER